MVALYRMTPDGDNVIRLRGAAERVRPGARAPGAGGAEREGVAMRDGSDGRASVLVVEDDAAINDVVCRRLAREGLKTVSAFSGTEAQLLLSQGSFDLVICDLMLPGVPGEDVVRAIRAADESLPIIVASARTAPTDKVDLLNLGADDYLAKPFDLDELAARVQVQLRHRMRAGAAGASGGEGSRRFGRWVLDHASRTLSVDGEPLALTCTEFNIIELMAESPGRVFTKQELFEHAWGEPYVAQDSTVSAHVSNLRAKLKPTGTDDYVQTVWGIGFRVSSNFLKD